MRNAKIHGRPYGTPSILAASVMDAYNRPSSFQFQEQWEINQPHRLPVMSSWSLPPPGWVKVNVDGCVHPSNLAGIGAVIHNDKGDFISAMSLSTKHWDSTSVELKAMTSFTHIIQLWMHECKGIIVEADNKSVVDHVRESMQRAKWQNRPDIAPDINVFADFHEVIFLHINREQNRLADYCAKLATQGDFVFLQSNIHTIPPTFFVVLEDRCTHVHS